MQKKIKLVGGFLYPDEKGKITFPPEKALQIEMGEDTVTIPVQKTRKKETFLEITLKRFLFSFWGQVSQRKKFRFGDRSK